MRSILALSLSAALVLLPACGGSSDDAPKAAPVESAAPARAPGTKFTVEYFNPGFAPVEVEVLKAGTGKVAQRGSEVTMHYVAKVAGKDAPYASSRQEGSEPKTFMAGMGQIGIPPGWDVAATQMREGDRWRLRIPAELGYGPNGGPSVPPNSDLEIDVEMVRVVDP